MAKTPIKKPITEELTPPDVGNFNASMGAFSSMLSPNDSILTSKGGNYSVYREVLRDDQVQSTFSQRRLAVVSKEILVIPASDDKRDIQIAEELKQNLIDIKFDSITNKMLYAIFYGYSVSEILWHFKNGKVLLKDIKVRDRNRFKFAKNDQILLHKGGLDYEKLPRQKFWHLSAESETSDDPYGLGLAHYLYWPTYFKRNDIKFWLTFLEKFGQPTVKGTISKGAFDDYNERKKALSALASFASDSVVLTPEGLSVEFMEAARSGAATYEAMFDKMNAAISKIIVGQTMTTDSGSSRSQAEVHLDVRDDIIKADADLICESFNDQVVKQWVLFNYGENVTPPRVYRDIEPKEDQNATAERDQKIHSMGFEPTQDYIDQTYGVGFIKRVSPKQNGFEAEEETAEFAEASRIKKARLVNRETQEMIAAGAKQAGEKWHDFIGSRLDNLFAILQDSDDPITFREHLDELILNAPPPEMVDALAKANFNAYALGSVNQDFSKSMINFAEAMKTSVESANQSSNRIIEAITNQKAPEIVVNSPPVNVDVHVPEVKNEPAKFTVERDKDNNIKSIKRD